MFPINPSFEPLLPQECGAGSISLERSKCRGDGLFDRFAVYDGRGFEIGEETLS